MAAIGSRRAPGYFWAAAGMLTAWGALGCYACLQQLLHGAEAMGPASDYDLQLYASLPSWYDGVYAIAVVSGLLGGIALLMRSSLARMLFGMSLMAVVVQFGWLFATTDIVAVKGAVAVVTFPSVIVAVTLFAIWYAGLPSGAGGSPSPVRGSG
jgi:hypothetical protein